MVCTRYRTHTPQPAGDGEGVAEAVARAAAALEGHGGEVLALHDLLEVAGAAVATALALFGTARIYNTIMRLKANSGEKENVD